MPTEMKPSEPMNLMKLFSRNEELDQRGVKVMLDAGGAWVRVRPSSNDDFQKKARELFKPHRAAHEQGTLDRSIGDEITCRSMAGTILTGWGEDDPATKALKPVDKWTFFLDADGKPLEFSAPAAAKMLIALPDFRKYISTLAEDRSLFREDEAAEALEVKNSSSGTAGR